MISINIGIRDQLHQDDRKYNPEFHFPGILKHEIVNREYIQNFCPRCADEYKEQIAKIYVYDACNDVYRKQK